MSIAKITRKGQITIPKDVRESLRISESDYVVVVVDGDTAILSPIRGGKAADLKGRLPATKPYPGSGAIRREVGRDLGKRMTRGDE